MSTCPRKSARITGLAAYLPEKILSNSDLEKIVDTSDEWIRTRTGIQERRIAAENEYNSDLGAKAAQKLIEKNKIDPKEIDLILLATFSPDYLTPSTAALVQRAIGATNAAAMDFQAACTGFIYGLSMAKAYIESGLYKNILLVATEKISPLINYEDRGTCVIFGDGAAAALIQGEGKGFLIRNVSLGADGEQGDLLKIPSGGTRNPTTIETVAKGMQYITMEGKTVFKHAVRRMEDAVRQSLEKENLTENDLSWMVPHQANIRIIEAIAKRFSLPMEKVFMTIHKYGNTSASSIPIALEELERVEQPKEGENLMLVGFGAGLTWGSSLLTQIEE